MKPAILAALLLAATLPLPAHAQIVQQQTLQFSAGVPDFQGPTRIGDKLYLLSTRGLWVAAQTFDAQDGRRLAQFNAEVRPASRAPQYGALAQIALLHDATGSAFSVRRSEGDFFGPRRIDVRVLSPDQQVLGEHLFPKLLLANGDAIYCDQQTISRKRGVAGAVQILWEWPSTGECSLDFDRLMITERVEGAPQSPLFRLTLRNLQTGAISSSIELPYDVTGGVSVLRESNALLVGNASELRALRIDTGAQLWSQAREPSEQVAALSVRSGLITRSDSQLCRRSAQTGTRLWCVGRAGSETYQVFESPRVVLGSQLISGGAPGATLIRGLDLETGVELWRFTAAKAAWQLGDEFAFVSDELGGLVVALHNPRTGLLSRRLVLDRKMQIPGRMQAVRLPTLSAGSQDLLIRKGIGRDSEVLRLDAGRERYRAVLPGGSPDEDSSRSVPRRLLSEPIFGLFRPGQSYNQEVLLDPQNGAIRLRTEDGHSGTIDRAGNGDWLIATSPNLSADRLERYSGTSLQLLSSVNFPRPLVRAREGGLMQFACGVAAAEQCVLSTDQAQISARRLHDASVLWQASCSSCSVLEINPARAALRGEPNHLLKNGGDPNRLLEDLSPVDGTPRFSARVAPSDAQFQYDGEHYLVASPSWLERRSVVDGSELAFRVLQDGEIRAFDTRFQRVLVGALRAHGRHNQLDPYSLIAPMISVASFDARNYAELSETLLQVGPTTSFAAIPQVDQVSVDSTQSGRVLYSAADSTGRRVYTLATVSLQPELGNITLGIQRPYSSAPTWKLRNDSTQTRTVNLVYATTATLISCRGNGVRCPTSLPALISLAPQATLEFRLDARASPDHTPMVAAYPVSHPTESQLGDNISQSFFGPEVLFIDGLE